MHFQQLQRDFIAHIKHPDKNAVPAGIEPRRMAIYSELFFNNVEGFIASAYPVLKTLYDVADWQQLIRQFFCQYACSSPYFLHIAEHFLQFLQQDYQVTATDPLFLLELAHYEWAELYLATKQVEYDASAIGAEQLQHEALKLSELSMLLAYHYPVHEISATNRPARSESPFFYLLYRNEHDAVKFILLNQISAALLHLLHDTPGSTLTQLIDKLIPMLPQYTHSQLYHGAVNLFSDFAAKGILQAFQKQ